MNHQLGDKFTIAGNYKRRTFLQWLRREPRVLKQFVIVDVLGSYSKHEESK